MATPATRTAWARRVAPGRLIVPRQVHAGLVVDADDRRGLQVADGVVATDARDVLGVLGADCPGLLLLSADARVAVHCGWRSAAAGIVATAVAVHAARSRQPPAAWTAIIGPGISGPCYQIDHPVLTAAVWPPSSLRTDSTGYAYLDLREAIRAWCQSAGIGTIVVNTLCTAGDDRLHSYRHQGRGLSQVLLCWDAINAGC